MVALNDGIQAYIQNQIYDIDEQSVSFEQVQRYNHYLIKNGMDYYV